MGTIDHPRDTFDVDFNGGNHLFTAYQVGDRVWTTDGEMRCRATITKIGPCHPDAAVPAGCSVIYLEPDYSTLEDWQDDQWVKRSGGDDAVSKEG